MKLALKLFFTFLLMCHIGQENGAQGEDRPFVPSLADAWGKSSPLPDFEEGAGAPEEEELQAILGSRILSRSESAEIPFSRSTTSSRGSSSRGGGASSARVRSSAGPSRMPFFGGSPKVGLARSVSVSREAFPPSHVNDPDLFRAQGAHSASLCEVRGTRVTDFFDKLSKEFQKTKAKKYDSFDSFITGSQGFYKILQKYYFNEDLKARTGLHSDIIAYKRFDELKVLIAGMKELEEKAWKELLITPQLIFFLHDGDKKDVRPSEEIKKEGERFLEKYKGKISDNFLNRFEILEKIMGGFYLEESSEMQEMRSYCQEHKQLWNELLKKIHGYVDERDVTPQRQRERAKTAAAVLEGDPCLSPTEIATEYVKQATEWPVSFSELVNGVRAAATGSDDAAAATE